MSDVIEIEEIKVKEKDSRWEDASIYSESIDEVMLKE